MLIQILLLLINFSVMYMYHYLTQQLNCSESKMCKIPENVPVPPPLPTLPSPKRRNLLPSPPPSPPPTPTPPYVAVRQPWRTLCHKKAIRVLVTAGVLILLLVIVAVVLAVILGKNTPGTNNKGVIVHVCVRECVLVCGCVGACVYVCVCLNVY